MLRGNLGRHQGSSISKLINEIGTGGPFSLPRTLTILDKISILSPIIYPKFLLKISFSSDKSLSGSFRAMLCLHVALSGLYISLSQSGPPLQKPTWETEREICILVFPCFLLPWNMLGCFPVPLWAGGLSYCSILGWRHSSPHIAKPPAFIWGHLGRLLALVHSEFLLLA